MANYKGLGKQCIGGCGRRQATYPGGRFYDAGFDETGKCPSCVRHNVPNDPKLEAMYAAQKAWKERHA